MSDFALSVTSSIIMEVGFKHRPFASYAAMKHTSYQLHMSLVVPGILNGLCGN